MNRFECLPNETLMEIFEYLDARDLFRAFYNLNSRFTKVLQSLNELCLIVSSSDRDQITHNTIFLPYIHTLVIKYHADVILNHYTNIRRLILFWLPYKLENGIFPHLEYLLIDLKNSRSAFPMNRLHETIFSNGFPSLKYCFLPRIPTIHRTERWTKLPALRVLKVGHIGLFTYIAILSTCPNLHYLYFFEEKVLQTSAVLPQYVKHENLRRLIIEDKYIGPISHVGVLNEYLSCVPNLEYLSIHVMIDHLRNLQYLQEFDWLASIISLHLPLLRRFYFHLPIYRAKRIHKFMNDNVFSQLEQRFKIMHKDRFQSRLIIDRKNFKHYLSNDQTDSSD
jgi:hypothetical protein